MPWCVEILVQIDNAQVAIDLRFRPPNINGVGSITPSRRGDEAALDQGAFIARNHNRHIRKIICEFAHAAG